MLALQGSLVKVCKWDQYPSSVCGRTTFYFPFSTCFAWTSMPFLRNLQRCFQWVLTLHTTYSPVCHPLFEAHGNASDCFQISLCKPGSKPPLSPRMACILEGPRYPPSRSQPLPSCRDAQCSPWATSLDFVGLSPTPLGGGPLAEASTSFLQYVAHSLKQDPVLLAAAVGAPLSAQASGAYGYNGAGRRLTRRRW